MLDLNVLRLIGGFQEFTSDTVATASYSSYEAHRLRDNKCQFWQQLNESRHFNLISYVLIRNYVFCCTGWSIHRVLKLNPVKEILNYIQSVIEMISESLMLNLLNTVEILGLCLDKPEFGLDV